MSTSMSITGSGIPRSQVGSFSNTECTSSTPPPCSSERVPLPSLGWRAVARTESSTPSSRWPATRTECWRPIPFLHTRQSMRTPAHAAGPRSCGNPDRRLDPAARRRRAWTDADGLQALERSLADLPDLLSVPGFRLSGAEASSVMVGPVMPAASCRTWPVVERAVVRRSNHRDRHAGHQGEIYAESVRAAVSDLVSAIITGRKPRAGLNVGLNAVYIAEAATRSHDSARAESVSNAEPRST